MSYVIAAPEWVAAAASDLAGIGSTLGAANAAAAIPTTALLAAGADEVSAAVATLFAGHAQAYQALSTYAATFHDQFVELMNSGGSAYAAAEVSNVQQQVLDAINAPTQLLLGRPLIGGGASGAAGVPGRAGRGGAGRGGGAQRGGGGGGVAHLRG
ncbi:PE family protein, partial [Mycobacterium kiyosense]|uniref:PE family protein n=1 Tax=Mycobacterium kiyosense TaxID=2871094 RepID=UPI00222E8418